MEIQKKNVLKFLVGSNEDLDKYFGHDLDNRKRNVARKWTGHLVLP